MRTALRRLVVIATIAAALLGLQQLVPVPKDTGRSTHGKDGFRKNLFRGILPPATVQAQSSVGPVGPTGGTQFTGGAVPDATTFESDVTTQGQILAKNGTAASPSYAFTATSNTGMYNLAGTGVAFSVAGNAKFAFDSGFFKLGSAGGFGFSSNADPTAANNDVGLARSAAGVLQVTNGSSGVGSLWGSPLLISKVGTNGAGMIADGAGGIVFRNDDGFNTLADRMSIAGSNSIPIRVGDASGWGINSGGAGSTTADVIIKRHAAGVMRLQDDTINSIRGFMGGGASVASATALPVPTGRIFHVTGTTNITSITSTNFEAGTVVTLIFDDVLTFTDGNNLALAGNFVTTAGDTITLAYDGTNWYETGRSVN